MNIIAFTPSYFPHYGGAETTLRELYTRLSSKFCIDLITIRYDESDECHIEQTERFYVHPVGRRAQGKFINVLTSQMYHFWKALSLLRRRSYGCAVLTYGARDFLLVPFLRILNIPFIVLEFHLGTGSEIVCEDQVGIITRQILKYVYSRAAQVSAISKHTGEFVCTICSTARVRIIKQGVDPSFWRVDNERVGRSKGISGEIQLVTVSRISRRKNLEDLVRSIAIIKKEEMPKRLSLNIVGSGDNYYREELIKLATSLNVIANISFLGFVSDKNLVEIMGKADVYVSASRYEGFGIANVQAMSCGLPVVCYDAFGTREYVIYGKTGFSTSQKPEEIAKHVIRLSRNPQLRSYIGQNARQAVIDNLNWDRYAEEHRNMIEDVINSHIAG